MSKGKDLINSIKYGLYRMLTLLSPLMCPFVTGSGILFTGITGWRNPLGRHT